MHFQDINYKNRWKADSLLELAWKLEQNISNVKRWFGTGVLSGGKPRIVSRDRTDQIEIIARYIFYKPVSMFRTEPYPAMDHTVSRYTVVGDGTVNCWIEGSKVEFLPQSINDSTIADILRPSYESTASIDRMVATKWIAFGSPILGFIGADQINYDATDEYEVRCNDGTVWIYMDRDEDFHESKTEMDASNFMLLWAVKLFQNKSVHPSFGRAIQEVQDKRTLIPKAFEEFKRSHFKDPVNTRGDLPFAGAEEGDLRVTTNTDSRNIWVYGSTGWTSLDPPLGAYAKEAFRTIMFQGRSSTFSCIADSSADQIIFNKGPHINFDGVTATDRITINFEANRDLDANGHTFKNIKHMSTVNMIVDQYASQSDGKITDATAKVAFLDSKDTMTIQRHANLKDVRVFDFIDMTRVNFNITATRMAFFDSQFDLYSPVEVNNMEVINLINQMSLADHAERHEYGGEDELDISDWQGITRDGQNVGSLTTWRANWRIEKGRRYMHRCEPWPPTDTTVTRYYSVGDGTVNAWIDGIKHEFLPDWDGSKKWDSTITSDFTAVRYSDATVLDISPATNSYLIWDEKNKYWRPWIFNAWAL